MKPLQLTLKNIGPFINESIDFEKLDDMFLVTGKTGSGKTTIFDAMTYALYGNISSSIATAKSRLRSDFCTETDKSFVEFTFLLNYCRYRVYRSVQDEHLTKNGTIAKSTIEVEFERFDESTQQWKRYDGTATQLTEKIEKLIGLSKNEFTQIVILPQGEFAQFLHEDSNARRITLSKLFPVSIFESISRKVSDSFKKKNEDLKSISDELERTQEVFEKNDYQSVLELTEKKLIENKKQISILTKKISDYSAQQQSLTVSKTNAIKYTSLQIQSQKLQNKLNDINDLRIKIDKSNEASILMSPISLKQNLIIHLEDDKKNFSTSKTSLKNIQMKLDSLEQKKQEFNEMNNTIQTLVISLNDIKQKASIADSLQKEETKYTTENNNLVKICNELFSSQQKIEEQVQASKEELEKQNKTYTNTKTMLDENQHKQEVNSLNNSASYLSHMLLEGKPCPVCGSISHPSPAPLEPEMLSLDDKIETLEVLLKNSEKAVKEAEENYRSNISLQEYIDSLTNTIKSLSISHIQEQNLIPKQKVIIITKEDCNKIKARFDSSSQTLVRIQTTIDNLYKQIGITKENDNYNENISLTLQKKYCELEKEKNDLVEQYNDYNENVNSTNNTKLKLETNIKSLTDNIQKQEKELSILQNEINQKLISSSFTTEDEICNAVISPIELERMKKIVSTYEKESTETETALKAIPPCDTNIEQVTQLLDNITTLCTNTEASLNQLVEEDKKLTESKTTAEIIIQKINSLKKAQSEIITNEEALFALNNDLNGINPKHIQFESWVLGTFLNDIVFSANRHFLQISENRYRFVLHTDTSSGRGFKGLDLTVNDSFTGKERSTKSLSGGETFMASLSLALALTDVVQEKSGGVKLDSLFIDEGFGSLDSETLDNAIDILNQIREQRMVGIISHVESLEQAIPCHIEVTKGSNGSTIKIKV